MYDCMYIYTRQYVILVPRANYCTTLLQKLFHESFRVPKAITLHINLGQKGGGLVHFGHQVKKKFIFENQLSTLESNCVRKKINLHRKLIFSHQLTKKRDRKNLFKVSLENYEFSWHLT